MQIEGTAKSEIPPFFGAQKTDPLRMKMSMKPGGSSCWTAFCRSVGCSVRTASDAIHFPLHVRVHHANVGDVHLAAGRRKHRESNIRGEEAEDQIPPVRRQTDT